MNFGEELDHAIRKLQIDPRSPTYCLDDAARAYKAMAEVVHRRRQEEMEEQRVKMRREMELTTKNIRLAAAFHAKVFEPDPRKRLQRGDEDWEWVEDPNQGRAAPPPTPAIAPTPEREMSPTCVFVLDEEEEEAMGVD